MVGQQEPHMVRNTTSRGALMSLLREGGQWDEDDDARAAVNKSAETWDDERMERLPLPGQVGYERQS
jgi:hypothetical protein